MEERKLIDANDTNLIKSAFKLLQMLNAVVYGILMVAMFVILVYLANDGEDVLLLAPLVAAGVFTLAFFIIKNQLVVKFGLYYDVRVLRLKSQQIEVDETPAEDAQPTL